MKRFSYLTLLLTFATYFAFGQYFTPEDYKKAHWMTLRFYGGQRMSLKDNSAPNWLIMDHLSGTDFTKDADGSHDLTGGWFDCGDHVLFGQTFFYAAYVVLKGYDAYPEGYDDYYSYDYSGYHAAKDFSWEGGKGAPNGIPDVLDEVRAACEFMIKAAPNATTFYSQKGNGDNDHKNWVTSPKMATLSRNDGGQSDGAREVVKNPNDGTMPAFCAATLALMSRVYAQFDPDFAAKCLTHAKYAYQYASGKKNNTAGAGSFYPANKNARTGFICAASELYWATNDNTYKSAAIAENGTLKDYNWAFGYNNNDDLAAYNLAMLGDSKGAEWLEFYVKNYYTASSKLSNGVYQISDNWGTFRYLGNAAWIVALYDKYKGRKTFDTYISDQVDFVMGKNSANFSCIVGFTPKSGSYSSFGQPHHRNVYLNDGNSNSNLSIPNRNKQFGFLGGGSGYNPNTLKNAKADEHTITEGGVDYQACLVGALGYINAMLSPVDPNKFGHPTAEVDGPFSLCGVGSATITATVDLSNLEPGERIEYRWYKDNASTPFKSGATMSSITVTQAGEYYCEIHETSGNDWTTKSKAAVVSGTLGEVDLGGDVTLCEITSKTFDAGITGTGITYAWSKDNKAIAGATEKTYTAYTGGTYKVTVSASGCSAVSGSAKVTSNLPEVVGDTICAAGQVALSITTPGSYEWYTVAEEGTAVASGLTYSPNITKTTTYYVQDASSINLTAGPKTTTFSAGSGQGWGAVGAKFTAKAELQIVQFTIIVDNIYNQGMQTFTIELTGDAKGTFVSDNINLTSKGEKTVTFSANPIVIPKAGNYMIKGSWSNAQPPLIYQNGPAYSTYQGDKNVIEFTGAEQGQNNPFPGLFNWVIQAGSTCARTPVFAVIDPNGNCQTPDTEKPTVPGTITVSDITTSSAKISWSASTDNVGVDKYEIDVNGTVYESATTSLTLNDLDENTEYTVKVRAVDEAGNASNYNTGKTFKTEKSTTTQTTALAAGWNLISFYALPEDASVANVFGTNISKISIIKNDDGFYKPGKADKLQSLTELKYGEAYLVKVTTAFSLTTEGVAPASTTVSLKAGWNLLGYPKATEANASAVLSGYSELKDLKGAQTKLTPGKGYYIKMNAAKTVKFE